MNLWASFSPWRCFRRPALIDKAKARVSGGNSRIARPQPHCVRRYSGQHSAATPPFIQLCQNEKSIPNLSTFYDVFRSCVGSASYGSCSAGHNAAGNIRSHVLIQYLQSSTDRLCFLIIQADDCRASFYPFPFCAAHPSLRSDKQMRLQQS